MNWTACAAVERVPGRVGGACVFAGTRVPVHALFENLEAGASASDFLEWFPGVERGQVIAVLAHAKRSRLPARDAAHEGTDSNSA